MDEEKDFLSVYIKSDLLVLEKRLDFDVWIWDNIIRK
jgi:hypothetical protein